MEIVNCGKGVHQREVRGVERLRSLPDHWYAFTNLDLSMTAGQSREIDVIVVADDRIFVIDLKDWNGRIESEEGDWKHNGRDTGPSPVKKAGQNARDLGILLDGYLKRQGKGARVPTPRFHGVVVITGNADIKAVAPTELPSVFHVEPFIRAVSTPGNRAATFKAAFREYADTPLTSREWKVRLGGFFNARTGPLKPGRRRYGNFVASSEHATFRGPGDIFAEYDAEDENASKTLGMLRVWDFSKADGRFQTEEGRSEIAGREQLVAAYLSDRGERFDRAFLETKAYDREMGIGHWEVFDRRRRLKRLSEFVATEREHLSREVRFELVRQVAARIADMHSVEATHLDLGPHSVWLEAPSTARLSHLMAARVPQVGSLGEHRYRFLSCAKVPEDVLGDGGDDPKWKDVFLLGIVAHHLLFDAAPVAPDGSEGIPEWTASVDAGMRFVELHGWFETALSLEPSSRFADAIGALRRFNAATASRPTRKEVLEGLESFRAEFRTQRQVFSAYPETQSVKESDRLDVWRSGEGPEGVLVKLWKRSAWGDEEREGPRILDFLGRANELVRSPPASCAKLLRACWLADAFCVVQEYVEGIDLATSLADEPDRWKSGRTALDFLRRLADAVTDLHAGGIAHGDLKPRNIVVTGPEPSPILIDLVDFGAEADGDVMTSAYAPPSGGRMERDRYAVGKIAEEILALADLDARAAADLEGSIEACRDAAAANATLLPLSEALERALTPTVEEPLLALSIALKEVAAGEVLPDEGFISVRRSRDGHSFFLRGAAEEVEVYVDRDGRPWKARRLPIDQGRIGRNVRLEFMSLRASLTLTSALANDFAGLAPLFAHPDFAAPAREDATGAEEQEGIDETEDATEDAASPDTTGDAAVDALAEEIAAAALVPVPHLPAVAVDVPLLWRRLIDVEADLTTEGNAVGASSYRRDLDRHVVQFEFSSGTFDFNRADTVGVERLDRKGRWLRLGTLDIPRSRPERILIEVPSYFGKGQRELVADDERLRFLSHFGTQSLRRRESAISRILSRQSREPALVDFFDPRIAVEPRGVPHAVNRANLDVYELNPVQVDALVALVGSRPLGLVQGPPGTGKTRFIAALAHYAITHGLARNVLLASQSHEAVNNAAEAVAKLFAEASDQPRILRVGNEGVVSDRLMPFHTGRVEQVFKDRFSAEESERLGVVGQALGLPSSLVEAIAFVEAAVRPVLARMDDLDRAEDVSDRVAGLWSTFEGHLSHLGIDAAEFVTDAVPTVGAVVSKLLERQWDGALIAPDRVAKLVALAALGRDFVGSVSTAQRSFETFLAGTRQIVAGTCVGLGRPSLGLTTTAFDLVIVDEAARCTASELSVPMQAGRWVVLVGDQAQLEPLHKNPEVVERVANETSIPRAEILRSDFERAFATPYGRACGRTLLTQYRMLSPIGLMVSETFYGGRLAHGRTKPEIDVAALPPTLGRTACWVRTDELGELGFQRREQASNSLQNPAEADIIVSMLASWHEHEPFREWVVSQERYAQAIGVICMYASQRDLIRRRLQTSNLSEAFRRRVKVDTVDSYQGKENPVVVVSLVRNNADGPQHRGAAGIREGFMSRANRVNVAASRAMDRLVLVGAMDRWTPGGPMSRLAAAFSKQVDAGEAEIVASATFSGIGRTTGKRSSARAGAEAAQ